MGDVEIEAPELDYDMWEGQFEFVGLTDPNREPQGLLRPPVPLLHYGTNGTKKNPAHAWCEEVADQVIEILMKCNVGVSINMCIGGNVI